MAEHRWTGNRSQTDLARRFDTNRSRSVAARASPRAIRPPTGMSLPEYELVLFGLSPAGDHALRAGPEANEVQHQVHHFVVIEMAS